MKGLLNTLTGVTLSGLVALTSLGCDDTNTPKQYNAPTTRTAPASYEDEDVYGTVISKEYISAKVVSKDTAAFGNETMRLGDSSLSLIVKTPKGIYNMTINDTNGRMPTKKETVNFALETSKSKEIRLKGAFSRFHYHEAGSCFGVDADDVIVGK